MPYYPQSNYSRNSRRTQARRLPAPPTRRLVGGGGAYYPRRTVAGAGAYRRPARVQGRGGYFTDLGTKYGAKVGGWLGGKAMSYLSGGGAYRRRYVGKGSYSEVEAGKMAPLPPTFASRKSDDYVEINHREFIGDIISSSSASTFATQTFNINAGDSLCFPWLAQIAQSSYQQYQFQGLIFEFKSMSADALNSTNTALGSVIASMNYDATDAAPTSRAAMENTDWSQCSKPSESFAIPIECKPTETGLRGLLYTRQSLAVPSGTDRKMFDMGVLTIATAGIQGTSVNLGSLYVTYKVRLYKAVQFQPLIQGGFFSMLNSGATTAGATQFGALATQVFQANNIGATVGLNTFTIPRARCIPGARYFVYMHWNGGSIAVAGTTIAFTGSATVYNQQSFDGTAAGQTQPSSSSGGTYTVLVQTTSFTISSNPTSDAVMTITAGSLPNGSCFFQLIVVQCNGDTVNLP